MEVDLRGKMRVKWFLYLEITRLDSGKLTKKMLILILVRLVVVLMGFMKHLVRDNHLGIRIRLKYL